MCDLLPCHDTNIRTGKHGTLKFLISTSHATQNGIQHSHALHPELHLLVDEHGKRKQNKVEHFM